MSERVAVPFAFGGRLALDLTWTVRFRAVLPTELLVVPEDLGVWLAAAGLPTPHHVTSRDLRELRDLREAIHRAATDVIDGSAIREADRSLLNRWAEHPAPFPTLTDDGTQRVVSPAGKEMAAALSAIARDAIELLGAVPDGRLRRCAGPRCSLLFHDDSRPGSRRWCSTERCGNKVNTKAYRQRRPRRDDG
jgi:predicted RNA-binding Zn ribbon-like protein